MKGLIVGFDLTTQEMVIRTEVHVSLSQLLDIFTPYPDDPNLYMVYPIDVAIATKLRPYTNLIFDFEHYIYEFDTID